MASHANVQNDSRCISSFCELARQRALKGDYKNAEWYYNRALTMAEYFFGPLHGDVGLVLQKMSEFYLEHGRPEKAEPIEQRIEEIISVYLEDQQTECGAEAGATHYSEAGDANDASWVRAYQVG